MQRRTTIRAQFITVLVVLLWAGAVRPASAQAYIFPYLGFNWGGDSGCPSAQNCEDKTLNIGAAIGARHGIIAFEEDFGYAKDFFGKRPDGNSSVLVLMSNGVLEIPLVPIVTPYGLVGVGLIKSHVDTSAFSLLAGSSNNFGYNVGGGLRFAFAPRVGARADWRYFRTFDDLSLAGFSVGGNSLRFWRGTFGVVVSF